MTNSSCIHKEKPLIRLWHWSYCSFHNLDYDTVFTIRMKYNSLGLLYLSMIYNILHILVSNVAFDNVRSSQRNRENWGLPSRHQRIVNWHWFSLASSSDFHYPMTFDHVVYILWKIRTIVPMATEWFIMRWSFQEKAQ